MDKTKDEQRPTRVRLTIEIPFEEVVAAARTVPDGESTVRDFARAFAGDGYTGQPFPPIMATVLSERVRSALAERAVVPIYQPEVRITAFGEDRPLTGCILVDRRPSLALPPLSQVDIVIDTASVDTLVDEMLEHLRRDYVDLTRVDRPAEIGDVVHVDLRAEVEDADATWARARDVAVEVGSDHVLAGLSHALVGLRPGQEATITVLVPGGPDAGRVARVTATVQQVMSARLPELDDEFAAAVGGYPRLTDLRGELRTAARQARRADLLIDAREAALSAIVDACSVVAPPDLVQDVAGWLRRRDEARRTHTGIRNASGDGAVTSQTGYVEEASLRLRQQIILDTIADTQDIRVTVPDLRDAITQLAEQARVSARQYRRFLARPGVAVGIHESVRREKALAHLLRTIVIRDRDGAVLCYDDLAAGATCLHRRLG